MTTESKPTRPPLEPPIRRALEALRERIRRYVVLDSLARTVVWLAAGFWATLAIDWFFEPPEAIRMLALAVVGFGLLAILARKLVDRLRVPLSDANMATLLERRFPHLDDSLLTTVTLSNAGQRSNQEATTDSRAAGIGGLRDDFSPAMLDQARLAAAGRIESVSPADVLDRRPLRRRVLMALLLIVSIGVYAGIEPRGMGVWARRCLAFSPEPWPRYTRLAMQGFGDDRSVKVARGREFELMVLADTRWPLVPEAVEVSYRTEGGARRRETMSRLGDATTGRRRAFQEYTYLFESVLAPIDLSVTGGDSTLSGYRIEMVENPVLHEMTLDFIFPNYMARGDQRQLVSGAMLVPKGTRITVSGTANKPLREVHVRSVLADDESDSADEPPEGFTTLLSGSDLGAERRSVSFALPPLIEDQTLMISLLDEDGIETREPIAVRLVAVPDNRPEMSVRLAGIGSAVTPDARLPLTGTIRDDYGLSRAWFGVSVDGGEEQQRPLAKYDDSPIVRELDGASLEVADFALKPGQRLAVAVHAADRYAPDEFMAGFPRPVEGQSGPAETGSPEVGPNVGHGDPWMLEVVTPEELRARLESRELVLRQRFETILADVTETRDLLVRIEFPKAVDRGDEDEPVGGDAGDDADDTADNAADDAASPAASDSGINRRQLAVGRALQNTRKSMHETASVATSFHDIAEQLRNNRIDTAELLDRLEGGIADPLDRLVELRFPELEHRIQALETALGDPRLGPAERQVARREADALLRDMQSILSRMLELESFNEAVETLRAIIALQEDLKEQVQRRRRASLRDLLD